MKQLRSELDSLKQQYQEKQKECKQLQSAQVHYQSCIVTVKEAEKEKALKEWRKEIETRIEKKYSDKLDKLSVPSICLKN